VRHKKTNDVFKKRRNKHIYDDLFNLDESPRNKKNINKRKTKKSCINRTTLKKDIKKKQFKRKSQPIISLNEVYKKNKNEDNVNDKEKDKDKEKDNDNIISSLEFSDLGDENEQKTNFAKYYKTFQKKNKNIKRENAENDSKSGANSNGNNNSEISGEGN